MNDTDFIVGLMRQGYNTEPNSLGFIPDTQVREYYVEHGYYLVQHDTRGRANGYILHGNPVCGRILRIAQAIIDVDRRNFGFGETMVQTLIERAKQANCRQIKLRCADDLPANNFWLHCGFRLTRVEFPGNKRQRAINTYLMDLWQTLL